MTCFSSAVTTKKKCIDARGVYRFSIRGRFVLYFNFLFYGTIDKKGVNNLIVIKPMLSLAFALYASIKTFLSLIKTHYLEFRQGQICLTSNFFPYGRTYKRGLENCDVPKAETRVGVCPLCPHENL